MSVADAISRMGGVIVLTIFYADNQTVIASELPDL